MKIGLDNYLNEYSVDEFNVLSKHEIRKLTLDEEIEIATTEAVTLRKIIKRIANCPTEAEKSSYTNKLAEKTGISKRAINKDIKSFSEAETKQIAIDTGFKIVHPSYEINNNFIILGFKETVVIDDKPEDRNIYIFGKYDKFQLIEDGIFQDDDVKLIFDVRERLLIDVNEKWSKPNVAGFINRPLKPLNLYLEIKEIIKRYVEYQSEAHYGLVTAWIISTYFHRCFNAIPFLFFYGKKGTGKSRSLDILERLAFNANKAQGVSVASLADTVDGIRGTFLFDQAESLSNPKNEEILGIITDSYTIGGGKRRIVHISNKSRKVMEFETYAPKAFASIKDINYDLKDRCILFTMPKTMNDYPYPEKHLSLWGEIRDKLFRLLLTSWKEVQEIYQNAGEGMTQRVKELWKPIDTILQLENVPGDEQQEIQKVFLASMDETQSELSDKEYELFEGLFCLLKDEKEKVVTVNDIAEVLDMDSFKSEKSRQIWTGKILQQLNLSTASAPRQGKRRAYLFSYDHIKNIFDRFNQTNGLNGSMGQAQEPQGVTTDHTKKSNGQQWLFNGSDTIGHGQETINRPLKTIEENSMVDSNALNDKDLDYTTIETINSESNSNNNISEENLSELEL